MDILSFKLGLDTAQLTAGAKAAVNAFVSIKAGMGSVAKAAAPLKSIVIGVKVAGDALWKLPDQLTAIKAGLSGLALPVKLAASAETTAVSFRTLVGDTQKANKALADITRLAASTPFEFPELAGAARSLVAFGEDSGTVAGTLRKIGDVASGVSTPIGELATLYGKARIAGVLMTEDINQLLERGIPILQEFAKQTGRSAGEIKDMASEGQLTFPMLERAFSDLTSGAGKFAGMMDQASGTMEGRLSTLGDSFKGVMVAVGEGLNEALKPLVSDASNKIDGLKGKAKELGEELGSAVNFTKVAFSTGKVGELIMEAFKAGGLQVADMMVRALEFGGKLIAAQLMLALPGPEGAKQEIREKMGKMQDAGLAGAGLGIKSLSDAADAASKDLRITIKNIRDVAEINAKLMKREAYVKQVNSEQGRASAKKKEDIETAGKDFTAYMQGEDARLAMPTVPVSGAGPKTNFKSGKEYDDLQARRRAINALDGGKNSASAKDTPSASTSPDIAPDLRPAGGGYVNPIAAAAGAEAPAEGGRGRIRRKGIVETMQAAYGRADKDKRGDFGSFAASRLSSSQMRDLTPDQRQQLRDSRGGLSATGSKAGGKGEGGTSGSGDQGNNMAAQAAAAVVSLLPEIARHIKNLEAA